MKFKLGLLSATGMVTVVLKMCGKKFFCREGGEAFFNFSNFCRRMVLSPAALLFHAGKAESIKVILLSGF